MVEITNVYLIREVGGTTLLYSLSGGWVSPIPSLAMGDHFRLQATFRNMDAGPRELIMQHSNNFGLGIVRYATVNQGDTVTEFFPSDTTWFTMPDFDALITFRVDTLPEGMRDSIENYIPVAGAVNEPPTADFTWAVTGTAADGYTVKFTDTSMDPDGTIEKWAWVFGDTFTSVNQHPTHDYLSLQPFTVSLTVTDNDGATDTRTRDVAPNGNGNGIIMTRIVFDRQLVQMLYDFAEGMQRTRLMDLLKSLFMWSEEAV